MEGDDTEGWLEDRDALEDDDDDDCWLDELVEGDGIEGLLDELDELEEGEGMEGWLDELELEELGIEGMLACWELWLGLWQATNIAQIEPSAAALLTDRNFLFIAVTFYIPLPKGFGLPTGFLLRIFQKNTQKCEFE